VGYFQDNWHADAKLFNEDQTLALSTIVSGTSYCEYLVILQDTDDEANLCFADA
jgi:hypothetical protein